LDLANPLVPVAKPRFYTGGGSKPEGIAIASNGLVTLGVVTLPGTGAASVLDLSNPFVPVMYAGPTGLSNPHGIALSPDGRFGFIENYTTNTILTFSLTNPSSGFTVATSVTVGTEPFSRNATMIYSR
jgi:hypothetical protein